MSALRAAVATLLFIAASCAPERREETLEGTYRLATDLVAADAGASRLPADTTLELDKEHAILRYRRPDGSEVRAYYRMRQKPAK